MNLFGKKQRVHANESGTYARGLEERRFEYLKVSVIIPTYKRPEKLRSAIQQVLEQSFQAFELIIVSDGSHEETDEVMAAYQEHVNIRYFSYPENKGGNHARNVGIKKARGEYIAFLDDDDLWARTKLEKQVELLDENPEVGLVYTGKKTVYPEYNVSYIHAPKAIGDLSEKIFLTNYVGSTSNVMLRKELFDEVGLFDEHLPSMQDREMWMRICQVTQIGAVDEPLFIYMNESGGNQISADHRKKLQATQAIGEKYNDFFQAHPEIYTTFKRGSDEAVLRIFQRADDKEQLIKYTKRYKEEYKDLRSRLVVLSTKVPFKWLLKIRALIE